MIPREDLIGLRRVDNVFCSSLGGLQECWYIETPVHL